MIARLRSGIPAATSSAQVVNAITIAVPRSGWVTTSRHAPPRPSAAGGELTQVVHALRACAPAASRRTAPARASTAPRAGTGNAGPDPARAPLTVTPDVRDVHRQHQHKRHRQQRPHMLWTLATPSRASKRISASPTAPNITNFTDSRCRCPSLQAARSPRRRCRPSPPQTPAGTAWRSAGCDARAAAGGCSPRRAWISRPSVWVAPALLPPVCRPGAPGPRALALAFAPRAAGGIQAHFDAGGRSLPSVSEGLIARSSAAG